ncbi:MAG TPA: HNH endonuclease, partial [Anaeromyxobacteraceae bacterium]|nr:HNH endonuclease [Anaeromyxobacteraceae bacterium]
MHYSAPSSLDSAALARRLGELAGCEREVQVEFLLHLAEFDTRRAWAEAGHRSLW